MEQNGSGDGGGTRVVMVMWRGRQWRWWYSCTGDGVVL